MITRLRANIAWFLKSLFYDAKGVLSLGRVGIAFALINVWALVWLAVWWFWYVTKHSLMTEAAPLASAAATVVSSVLSAQLLTVAATYWAQAKFGGGGVAPATLRREDAITAVEAADVAEAERDAREGGHA